MAEEEHPTCKEHSGLVAQVEIVCAEMRESTKAAKENTLASNQLCVEIRGLVVKNDQTEKDINNLGKLKADKVALEAAKTELELEIKPLARSFSLLQKIFYGSLITGIFVGVFFLVFEIAIKNSLYSEKNIKPNANYIQRN